MISVLLVGIGQSIVTAALTTAIVLHVTNACQYTRDIRNMLWWDRQLQEIEPLKKWEVKA